MSSDSNFSTGAVRSADADATRFDLIHPVAMLALARTYGEGAVKYGDSNWERGMDVASLLNHAIRHIYLYLAGDDSEPHLPHAAWGLMSAIASDTLWPDVNLGVRRGPGCTLTPDGLARQEAGDPERKAKRASGAFDGVGHWTTPEIPEVRRILEQRAEAALRAAGPRDEETDFAAFLEEEPAPPPKPKRPAKRAYVPGFVGLDEETV